MPYTIGSLRGGFDEPGTRQGGSLPGLGVSSEDLLQRAWAVPRDAPRALQATKWLGRRHDEVRWNLGAECLSVGHQLLHDLGVDGGDVALFRRVTCEIEEHPGSGRIASASASVQPGGISRR